MIDFCTVFSCAAMAAASDSRRCRVSYSLTKRSPFEGSIRIENPRVRVLKPADRVGKGPPMRGLPALRSQFCLRSLLLPGLR
jgi:hypothetical protein